MKITKIIENIMKSRNEDREQDPRFLKPVTAKNLGAIFEDCYDYSAREIFVGGEKGSKVYLAYIDGLSSGISISDNIIRPLTSDIRFKDVTRSKDIAALIEGGVVYCHSANKREDLGDIIRDLLSGFCAVIFDDLNLAITLEVISPEKRGIDQPKEEKVVKGPKDAFVEVMKTNTMLIRRKLRDPDLKIVQYNVGEVSGTNVAVVYIDGFTNTEIVKKVQQRVESIKIEGLLSAAELEEYIVDNPRTPFPQMQHTERPDKFCLNLLEGRVGILVEGLPLGFLAPGTFAQFFKVPEDIAQHWLIASVLTVLRYAALVLSVMLPAFYVAVAMYHQEMLPTKLMLSIIESKQAVPLPTAAEVLAMLLAFELLQEAGLRLNNPLGETIGILGALVVGQSAVEAKLVSPVVVVLIALSGIAGYTIPNQDMSNAFRIMRFLLVITSILAGLFGLVVGVCLLLYHLCTLDSFGVAYMTPFAGGNARELLRAMTRSEMRKRTDREPALKTEDKK